LLVFIWLLAIAATPVCAQELWTAISAKDVNTAAIKNDGTLWIWGTLSNYQKPTQIGNRTNWKR